MSDQRLGGWIRIRHPGEAGTGPQEVAEWVGVIETLIVSNPNLALKVMGRLLEKYRTNRLKRYEFEAIERARRNKEMEIEPVPWEEAMR